MFSIFFLLSREGTAEKETMHYSAFQIQQSATERRRKELCESRSFFNSPRITNAMSN